MGKLRRPVSLPLGGEGMIGAVSRRGASSRAPSSPFQVHRKPTSNPTPSPRQPSPVLASLCDWCVLDVVVPTHAFLSSLRLPAVVVVLARQVKHRQPLSFHDTNSWPLSDADFQVLSSPSARRLRTTSGQCWKHQAAATPMCAIHLLASSRHFADSPLRIFSSCSP